MGKIYYEPEGQPEKEVEADTITFKRHWDRYMDRNSLEGFGPNVGRWDWYGWDTLVNMGRLG